MRVLIALGGNALLHRGERPDADVQQFNVTKAAAAIARVARTHQVVITHGNGPQVGMLALESASDPGLSRPYPLDVLDAQTQGMIGYILAQALQNELPDRQVATLLTQTLVNADDPAFDRPTKFVGPTYSEDEANRIAAERGWTVRPDGDAWRRVVASPQPQQIIESASIRTLVSAGSLVVCAGGGGVPVVRDDPTGHLRGVEAVVDKDLTAELLARTLGLDALVLLTDVPNVVRGFGTPDAQPIGTTTPTELRSEGFPDGSMGPKVHAACRFVELTGGMAAIGAMEDADRILAGEAGTIVEPAAVVTQVTENGLTPAQ